MIPATLAFAATRRPQETLKHDHSQALKPNVAPIAAATRPKIANQPRAVKSFVRLGLPSNGRSKSLNFGISNLVTLIFLNLMRGKDRCFDPDQSASFLPCNRFLQKSIGWAWRGSKGAEKRVRPFATKSVRRRFSVIGSLLNLSLKRGGMR